MRSREESSLTRCNTGAALLVGEHSQRLSPPAVNSLAQGSGMWTVASKRVRLSGGDCRLNGLEQTVGGHNGVVDDPERGIDHVFRETDANTFL